jgi:hypothetical protein
MARQNAWVLALFLACAPAIEASAADGASHDGWRQGRADRPQTAVKDSKDKPQPVTAAAPSDRERRKWWLYDRAELGISDKQSTEINQIFESTIPKLREARQEQEKSEEELSRTIKEHKADLATISMLIDRAESARSQYSKMRVLMLYRMHLILTADQRSKLDALRTRQEAGRSDKDPAPGRRFLP